MAAPNTHAEEKPAAPIAAVRPKVLENHGTKRVDNYYWLRDRDNPEVVKYLEAENAYTDAVLADVKDLETSLFEEIKGRIKQDDSSVPYVDRGYEYYTRYEPGKQYPLYCRKLDEPEAAEEVMLDVNQLAAGRAFCQVVGFRVSPDNKRASFAVDFTGRRKYQIRFKDLQSGELAAETIEDTTGGCVWAEDSETVFYTKRDPQTLRAFLVMRHRLGGDVERDVRVFEEQDAEFSCGVSKSRSRKFIFISSRQTLSTEVRYLDATNPTGECKVFLARSPNHEYSISHLGGKFYIRSNDDAENFRLFSVADEAPQRENWKEVIPHRENVLLRSFTLFDEILRTFVPSAFTTCSVSTRELKHGTSA